MKTRTTLIMLGLVLISGIMPALAKEIEVPVEFNRRNMATLNFTGNSKRRMWGES